MKKTLLEEPYLSRYLRWENRRIEQMGFINNLLTGLASILLFWMLQGSLEEKLVVSQCINWVVLIAGFCFLLAVVFGLWLAFNRLNDFRKTAELIRQEHERASTFKDIDAKQQAQLKRVIEKEKNRNKNIGNRSWSLLVTQFILFISGLLSLGIAVVLKASNITQFLSLCTVPTDKDMMNNPNLSLLLSNAGAVFFVSVLVLIGLFFTIYQIAKRKGKNEVVQTQVEPLTEKLENLRLAKSADEELILVLKNRINELDRHIRNIKL